MLFRLIRPLGQRFSVGEGLLIAINLSILIHDRVSASETLSLSALTVTLLAVLYLYNDLMDASEDRGNPKKDVRLTEELVAFRDETSILMWFLVVALVGWGWLHSSWCAAAVAAAWFINMFYSRYAKRRPVLDLLVAGAWGAAIAAVVSRRPDRLLLVGSMTLMSHVIQMRMDAVADRAKQIQTSLVSGSRLAYGLVFIAAVLSLAAAWPAAGAWAISFPVATLFLLGSRQYLWQIAGAKLCLGVGWLAFLGYV